MDKCRLGTNSGINVGGCSIGLTDRDKLKIANLCISHFLPRDGKNTELQITNLLESEITDNDRVKFREQTIKRN